MAPIATSSEPCSALIRATIAISVSGVAVPTAARTLPTAPSPRLSLWPIHSIALVNSNAPERTIAKLTMRSRYSTSAG